MLGELLDRVAAIEQHALVAVDIGDLGFAARRRGEAGVVGEHAGLGVELADIDDVGPIVPVLTGSSTDLLSTDERAGSSLSWTCLCGRVTARPRAWRSREAAMALCAATKLASIAAARQACAAIARRQRPRPGRADRAEALVAPEHRQHVEDAGRGRAAGQRGAQRLRHLAELGAGRPRHSRARPPRSPRRSSRSSAVESAAAAPASMRAAAVVEDRRGLRVDARAGASANRNAAPSSSSTSVLARSFRPGMAASSLARMRVVERRRRPRRPAGRAGSPSSASTRSRVGAGAHVVAVEVLELGEVEARRRAADAVEVEGRDHLVGREELAGRRGSSRAAADSCAAPRAGSPWRDRLDAERAVALRQLGAVRPVDQRDMRHGRAPPSPAPRRSASGGPRW